MTMLADLRAKVTAQQRSILDMIWTHIKTNNVGLPERPLLEAFGKAALSDALEKLGGTVLYSNHEDNKLRYNVGVVGVFLTSEGPRLEQLLERYLITLRDAYLRNRDIEQFSSQELASWEPTLQPEELNELRHILYRAHGSLASRVSGWNANEWLIGVEDEVVELKSVTDWPAYIEPRIMQWYDAKQPGDERQRMGYLASQEVRDPIWEAIQQKQTAPDLSQSKSAQRKQHKRNAPRSRPRKLDLSFISADPRLLAILERDWQEACQHIKAKAWKSCVLLCGGIIEGMLLWQLEDVQRADAMVSNSPKVDVRYEGESLSSVIRKSKELGLIAEDEEYLMDWARTYRNLIHPGNQRREGRTPEKSHADLAIRLVQVVAVGVRRKARGRRRRHSK